MRDGPEGMLAYAANITNQPADRWRLTREEAIRRIEAKEEAFYRDFLRCIYSRFLRMD